jgi:flap endonuclease-1
MLKLMGMPIIEAPGEAEATCATLCKAGKVFASATEDLDALTFGTKILLRGFNSKKEPITEINHDEMMKVIRYIK